MSNNFKPTQDIWVNNLKDLFKKEHMLQFFPSTKFNVRENINSIMRLAIYISVILTIVYRNIKYMIILVLVALITYIYYMVYKTQISAEHLTDMLHKQLFVKEVKSKPYNPLQHKLVGEKNEDYTDAYLVSDNKEITDNMLYAYNKIYTNVDKEIDSNDTLNQKEVMLNVYPLADKTGIPDFAKFAKNIYGTKIEDRRELIKRGFISKADNARLQQPRDKRINYDPIDITN